MGGIEKIQARSITKAIDIPAIPRIANRKISISRLCFPKFAHRIDTNSLKESLRFEYLGFKTPAIRIRRDGSIDVIRK